jgi:hypothetical protein
MRSLNYHKTYNVDHKGILRNVFRCDIVVTAQEEDNFRCILGSFEVDSQLESVDVPDASVEDVVTVPTLLSVDEFIAVCDLSGTVEDCVTVTSGKNVMTNDHHG